MVCIKQCIALSPFAAPCIQEQRDLRPRLQHEVTRSISPSRFSPGPTIACRWRHTHSVWKSYVNNDAIPSCHCDSTGVRSRNTRATTHAQAVTRSAFESLRSGVWTPRCWQANCSARSQNGVMYVRMEELGSHWTDFDEIWYLSSSKTYREN